MTSRLTLKRALTGAFACALVAGALLPAAVSAASPAITFNLRYGDECLNGHTTNVSDIAIKWRDAMGNLKASETLATTSGTLRLTLYLLEQKRDRACSLAQSLTDMADNVVECEICCNLTAYSKRCTICQKSGRNKKFFVLCLVFKISWLLKQVILLRAYIMSYTAFWHPSTALARTSCVLVSYKSA